MYMKAGSSWTEPTYDEMIPHSHTSSADGPDVPIYYCVSSAATKEMPVPTMLLVTGLDGLRPADTQRPEEFLKRGSACVIVHIPDTADYPAIKPTPIALIGFGILSSKR